MAQKFNDYYPNSNVKIYPENIAGVLGLPSVGNIFYVDPNSGSDTANDGSTANNAYATIGKAYAQTTSGNNDVVLLVPTATSGRTTETAAITWSNDYTHLIGVAAPTVQNTRAGLNGAASTVPMTVSADGCIFANMTWAAFNDIDELCVVTGSRNRFHNIHFAGLANATAADTAAGSSCHLTGGQENYFTNCTFGVDTVTRGAANFGVEFESAASRNVFEDCRFVMHADADTPFHVKLEGTNAIDRWVEFKNCSFYTFWTNNADDITAAFETSEQTATAHILMTGSFFLEGATDWEASASGIIRFNNYDSTGATATMGIALTNT